MKKKILALFAISALSATMCLGLMGCESETTVDDTEIVTEADEIEDDSVDVEIEEVEDGIEEDTEEEAVGGEISDSDEDIE